MVSNDIMDKLIASNMTDWIISSLIHKHRDKSIYSHLKRWTCGICAITIASEVEDFAVKRYDR